jgi:hypothetical protein
MRPRAPVARLATAIHIGLVLVVASMLLGAGPARGQAPAPAPTLGGYSGTAASSGLHVTYAPVGLLPTGPPVDLGAPDALATVSSGPSTFARASVADPGDLLANPGALLALASPDYPPGLIPPYPFRVSATSSVGAPTAESVPAPGLAARVAVEPGASSAEATTPRFEAPAVVTLGSMSAEATTKVDATTVTLHARTEIGTIDILGLVHIDAIITDLTATSTGGEPTLEGGTTVVGASILGQPVVIDSEGIRSATGGLDLGPVLATLGVRLTLPGPVELAGGSLGQLASTGLRLDIEISPRTFPVIDDILELIPPIEPLVPGAPSVEDLLAVARAQHLVSVEIGRGVVLLNARTPAPRTTAPPTSTPTATPPTTAGRASAPVRSTAPVASPAAPVAGAPVAPVATDEVPVASVSTGIGAIAVLLLLLQPFIGDRLARLSALQLATDQETCPWQRR